ncbi:MAG TPA: hypothetical protein VIC27_06660 [Ktedonobacterales bacterium]
MHDLAQGASVASVASIASDIPQLSDLGMIPAQFQHYDKLVTVGADLSLPRAYLKWYDIRRPEVEMPATLIEQSRAWLQAEGAAGRLAIDGQLGFVELHHCTSVAFLLVCTWNNENELWDATYVKALTEPGDFAPIAASNGIHRAMFCVWELAPVWHERQAWVRYLRSGRDDDAKRAWFADRYIGRC